ncbi:MAG: valine--tRNA ligase [Ignavibacteriae bacterium]|nr:MAG: valine--tRNA ligase [Ignavibacteriota bacterium]
MKEISKTYNPQEVELELIKYWEKNKFFTPEDNSGKPKYSMVIPPPNVTGNLHLGHILDNTVQDIYVRWKRMSGYNVLWLPGTDHAGIATQTKVEKHIKEQGLSRYDLGREKFVEKVWEWKDIYHENITGQLKRMGASVDWTRERFTMDEGLSKAVRKVFVSLYKKGLIYKGKRIINWDPVAQTALSDEEVIYKEKKDKLYYIKYNILNADSNSPLKYVTIATTRPETMLGDTAVAVNPNDSRYTGIIGKKVILPIVDKAIPVIADEYVDMDFGTGALKITPAHDPNDFEIGIKYGLEQVQVIDHQGKMNEKAGKYSGLDRFAARKQIVARLQDEGLIEKIDEYTHNVGYSERGGIVVEPYLSDQWFVSMKTLAEPALNAVLSGKVRFHPERWEKVYNNWMTNIRDWCISRQLWWGHQIPVWYNKKNGEMYCEIEPPEDIENWEQDPDVLDTWFSSWLWPFTTMGWPDDTEDLKKFYPTDFLSTGPDIIFFWVARMIMAAIEFTGKIPFYDVYFHNIIRDEIGRKMSKSLGNSPDVIDVMNEYGTDALRFTLVYLAPQGVDVFFSKEKCEMGRNFANKIWNASRFLLMRREQFTEASQPDYKHDIFDKWIESRLNSAIQTYVLALDEYKINEASKALHEFIWGDFCDWYIEVLKIKSNEQPEAGLIIFDKGFEIFDKVLRLLHPVMPFITEELWQAIGDRKENESISISEFPVLNENVISKDIETEVALMQELVTSIRNLRAELNLSPSVKCDVVIACENEKSAFYVDELSSYIKSLAKIGELQSMVKEDFAKIEQFKSLTSVVGPFQIYVKIEGLIDIEQEKQRLDKEIQRTESFLISIEKKLSNEKFVQKASPEVVENERKKQEDSRQKLEKLKEHYNSLVS